MGCLPLLPVLSLLCCWLPMLPASGTDRPIVGILTLPLASARCVSGPPPGTLNSLWSEPSCLSVLYVKWLEQAGVRVVPLRYDSPERELNRLFGSINGLLFTGGETHIWDTNSTYDKAARWLFRKAVAAHQAGDYFPVWGTCLGLQLLAILVAEEASVLQRNRFLHVPYMAPLNLTAAARFSRLLGSDALRQQLGSQPLTCNLHHDGVSPETFATNARLASFFRVLSTNVDPRGQSFVSTIEGISAPVYGVQWHPERPQYDWDLQLAEVHTPAAATAMQDVATFFAAEARKSGHRFRDPREEAAALIYNYPLVGRTAEQWYAIRAVEGEGMTV